MKNYTAMIEIHGIICKSGAFDVFLGATSAALIKQLSFADILNEDTGEGYQRPFNRTHSLDFKAYITRPNSSTPPLTFNLRKDLHMDWKIIRETAPLAKLILKKNSRCLAQVDCQHRLGELDDVDVELPFMIYIGLDLRQEMAIFNVINSKAKGLSSSLTDYHESTLLADLATEAPHLYIARKLNDDNKSPWYRMIRYGGESTSGLKRRSSFRMMQKTIAIFLNQVKGIELGTIEDKYKLIVCYWQAVRASFPMEWHDSRNHLITKGVGLYSLMMLLADIVRDSHQILFTQNYFENALSPLISNFDWSSNGRFASVGGRKGVQEVYLALKEKLNARSSR